MDTVNQSLRAITEAASDAVGQVLALDPIGGGHNSQVFRASTADGRVYALKVYPRGTSDRRDRLGNESDSLRFLWKHGIRQIPETILVDRQQGFALYEYIDGQQVPIREVTERDIDAAIDFLTNLQRLTGLPESQSLRAASEAFFEGEAIVENLSVRLERFHITRQEEPELAAFLDRDLIPALDQFTVWSKARLGESWNEPLPAAQRILSPSDFGFHNALRTSDRALTFVDFEYFGWDDPAKTISDFLLHPAMPLTLAFRQRFALGVAARLGQPVRERVLAVYPLFGLKWCLICMNEFLPAYRHRHAVSLDTDAWDGVKSFQLSKARAILNRITSEHEHFPYFG